MGSFSDIILNYVCPFMGSIMASVMFAAPVRDLRQALIDGSLGDLNPFPWSFCAGNTLGWVVYGYYTKDPFVLAANLPGLVLSIWLNSGASKLQYLELIQRRRRGRARSEEDWDASRPLDDQDDASLMSERERAEAEDAFVMVPQEKALLRVLSVWSVVIVYVGWFSRNDPATIVGVVVNMNLIFFYAAPLQTMQHVIATKNSASIHLPTTIMNWVNTSFWIGYGFARRDVVILLPNVLGLCFGLMQGALRAMYPSRPTDDRSEIIPVLSEDEQQQGVSSPEEELPSIT